MRGRRVARRTARRTTRRVMRRRRRRRILVGGMVLLAVGGTAAAIKLTQKDAQRIEEHTGASVEELTEEELVQAMKDLGIQSIELDDNDRAIITDQGAAPPGTPLETAPAPAPAAPEETYLDELEKLADLRDRGIISDEDFEAKKRQLLGL
ncbi:MAG: SHOCT domain-containing protein [Anaerolineae bacterium]|jgi:ribosomal protein L12E/L44/L45/RPP1/RPP2